MHFREGGRGVSWMTEVRGDEQKFEEGESGPERSRGWGREREKQKPCLRQKMAEESAPHHERACDDCPLSLKISSELWVENE